MEPNKNERPASNSVENPDGSYDDFVEVPVTHTKCNHYYMPAENDPNSGLLSAQCGNCWHGCSYDPEHYTLVDGKLVPKEPYYGIPE